MSAGIAFVAGATGYTGGHVVPALVGRGVQTWAHVRPDSSRLESYRQRFEALGAQVDTTAWEASAMCETMQRLRPTLVFGLLGTTRHRAKQAERQGRDPAAESYQAVDVGLTVLLMNACREAEIRPRFVYLSSLGSSPKARTAYLASRWKVERALRDSGLPWTVARPGIITGPDREDSRPAEVVAGRVVDGMLRVAGALGAKRIRERYRSISGRELGAALARVALDPAAENRVVSAESLR